MAFQARAGVSPAKINPFSRFRQVGLAFSFLATTAFVSPVFAREATILVQLNEYKGEGAYFALYLVDPDGRYEKTLWVSGDEVKYFADMPRWWKYHVRKPQELDAITGASTKAGDRSVMRIEIDDAYIDSGYTLRVETAVEDQDNHPQDVEAKLASDEQGAKTPGTGYVRHIRYKW